MNKEERNTNLTEKEYVKKLETAINDLNNCCDKFYKEKGELKQALIDIREICNYYGITLEQNDDLVLRSTLKDISQIIDKVLDLDKVRGE